MTDEVEASVDMVRKIKSSPADSVDLHSLELLLEVANNLLADGLQKAKITSTIKSAIYETIHSVNETK